MSFPSSCAWHSELGTHPWSPVSVGRREKCSRPSPHGLCQQRELFSFVCASFSSPLVTFSGRRLVYCGPRRRTVVSMKARKPSRPRRSQEPAYGFSASKEEVDCAREARPRTSQSQFDKLESDSGEKANDLGALGSAEMDSSTGNGKIALNSSSLGRPAVTRDDRLREELAHPFRRPKLVIFGTLCLSAFVGTLFAAGRFALGSDPPDVFGVNLAVNSPAIALFGFLAKREVDFGRRSLGVIAGCPEARDLPVDGGLRFSGVGGKGHVYVLAGRARDLADVLVRSDLKGFSLVAVAVDAGELDPVHLGPHVWAPNLGGDVDIKRAWDGWLVGVKRERRQVAVFRIPAASSARGMGDEYVVAVEESSKLDLTGIVLEGATVWKDGQ